MRTDRRKALGLLALGALAPSAVSPAITRSVHSPLLFRHGVASGDPLTDGLIIWTRVTPALEAPQAVEVRWQVAADPGFETVVASGAFATGPHRDGTVKVDVRGLKPGRDYWYRFDAAGQASPVGRGRTLPAGPTPEVVLAVAGCSRYECGYFNAYDAISRLKRVDAVIHLGDYLYEAGENSKTHVRAAARGLNRRLEPRHEIVTLEDYRARHALYKADSDLQAAHARAPFICVWDDHESANNCWQGGAEVHPAADRPAWTARKAVALQAYYEWMPIRDPEPGRPFEAINRAFDFGDLASLVMLETRLLGRAHQLDYAADMTFAPGRDGQPKADYAAFRRRLEDPRRQLLGPAQEAWLGGALRASRAGGRPWQVLGSQVPMARITGPDLKASLGPGLTRSILDMLPRDLRAQLECRVDLFAYGAPYNLDTWDGYPAARERLYAACREADARPIVISGDSHAFWANDLHDHGGRQVGVEFGTTSVTSPGFSDRAPGVPLNRMVEAANPEVRFCDQAAKGFLRLTLRHDEAVCDMVGVSTIRSRAYSPRLVRRFRAVAADAGGLAPLQEI